MDNNILFDQKFNILSLMKFSLPSIIVMLILSMYQFVDGFFVSNFIDTSALGAINIVYPVILIGSGISLMIGSCGSILIAKTLGEGNKEKANSIFSFLIFISILLAVFIGVVGTCFIDELVTFLGATDVYFEMAKSYLQIHFYFIVYFYLQNIFQILFVTASKPRIGLITMIIAGILNIILNYVFIVVLNLGTEGAALSSGISFLVPAVTGIMYFSISKNPLFRFSSFKFHFKILLDVILNSSSELLGNIANAITTLIFNYQFYKFYQNVGVDSITIVLYFQFFVSSLMYGFSSGIIPIISYKYGKRQAREIQSLKRKGLLIVLILGGLSFILSLLLISPVAKMLSGGSQEVYDLTVANFGYFSFSLLFMGISIYASSYFTAIHDDMSSLRISVLRTFVFLIASLFILPLIFDEIGLWGATAVAEFLGAIVSLGYLLFKKLYIKRVVNKQQVLKKV